MGFYNYIKIEYIYNLIKESMIDIIKSILSAFFGVQNNKKFSQDDAFIEKHGIKFFLIIGFFVAILFLITLTILVKIILNYIK